MVLALIFGLLLSVACLVGSSYGLGKHIWNLSDNLLDLAYDTGRVTKALYGCYLAYSTSITFTKLSIIATYTRIFPNGALRYSIYAVGMVIIIFWITSIFAIIFTCVPIQAAWDYSITDAKCIHILDYFYTAAGVNIATDLLLCFLPLPTIWKLQMPKAQRIVVCVIFGMGTFACVATTLRLTQLGHLSGIDIPYQSVGSLNWSEIEVGTAIVCASISSLRPLATRYLPSAFTHFTQHTSDLPSLRLDNTATSTSGITSKVAHPSAARSMTQSDTDRIYVEGSFDVTELDTLEKGGGKRIEMPERKPSEVWTEGSRGSSQEVLVRDFEPSIVR
ncbi:hypothetical protein N431DRAFT_432028 [Stipitochalara longipes BDJ]|nr:hypothetical protein N431DRAFT_432028 [Stipitochalara longipes BDJ]